MISLALSNRRSCSYLRMAVRFPGDTQGFAQSLCIRFRGSLCRGATAVRWKQWAIILQRSQNFFRAETFLLCYVVENPASCGTVQRAAPPTWEIQEKFRMSQFHWCKWTLKNVRLSTRLLHKYLVEAERKLLLRKTRMELCQTASPQSQARWSR